MIAPWVLDGAINRASFDTYVERVLASTLRPGQIVVADNLSSHKSVRAIDLLRAQGNTLIFLPPYSPDPCVAKNSPPDCFLHAPHPSKWPSPSSRP
ncbi:MAG: transposase [Pseudomonadota bacterium]